MENLNCNQNKILTEVEKENFELKNDVRERKIQIGNLNEELKSKVVEIKKIITGLKSYKCDFQADTGNMFIIHLSKEHTKEAEKILRCEECIFSCTKEQELEVHRSSEHIESVNFSCLKCYFKSKKIFYLGLYTSTNHPENLDAFSRTRKVKKFTKVKS